MTIKKKTSGQLTGRRSEPKLFRCTGFGNCSMVFTRSEHLARHARKHTGEKPFQCISPGCNRMFSRFDNMMQHANTHTRMKKKDIFQKEEDESPSADQVHIHPAPSYPPTPSPPKSYQDVNEHFYYTQSNCCSPILPPPSISHSIYCSPDMMSLPIHYATPTHSYYTQLSPHAHHSSSHRALPTHSLNRKNSFDDHTKHQLPSPVNTVFEANEPMIKIEGVEITQDEYEAIEGFSRLVSTPIVHQARHLSNPTLLSRNSNLNSFRQQVAVSQESFQRYSYL
ncbi:hypothetical protein BD560DRAFT_443279 [Blakeslea trispora]|nr:hypothetical protein BD560DRAFT_443279 [Blakeslea trispora]